MADAAQSLLTGETVWIDDIKSGKRPILPGETFKCIAEECSALVQADALDSILRPPYFAEISKKNPHIPKCPGSSISKRSSFGSDRDLSIPEKYPSKLILKDSVSRDVNKTSDKDSASSREKIDQKDTHHHTSSALGKVVRWFLQNPQSGDALLEIDGCWQKCYGQIFRYLSYEEGKILYGQHILFSELEFKDNISDFEDRIEFKVKIFETGKKSKKPGVVVLSTNELSEVQKNFAKKFVIESTKAKQDHWRKAKEEGLYSKWTSTLFFLGIPDDIDPCKFHIKHYKGIYACALEMPRLRLMSYGHMKALSRSIAPDIDPMPAPLSATQPIINRGATPVKSSSEEVSKKYPKEKDGIELMSDEISTSPGRYELDKKKTAGSDEMVSLHEHDLTTRNTQKVNNPDDKISTQPAAKKGAFKRFLDWLVE